MTDQYLLDDQTRLPVAPIIVRSRRDDDTGDWTLAGVVAGSRFSSNVRTRTIIRSDPDAEHFLWRGFWIRLRRDQAGDYALNLGSPMPSIFVICRCSATGLQPEEVTVSLDDAQGLDSTELRDAEWQVLKTPLPAEIGRWMAEFVDRHYQPPRRGKGRRRNGDYERSGRATGAAEKPGH